MKTNIKMLVAAVALAVSSLANASFTPEQEAYMKAIVNVNRVACLREIIDEKIAGDIAEGKIRDFGNVLNAKGLCASYETFSKARAQATPEQLVEFEKRAKKFLKEKYNA